MTGRLTDRLGFAHPSRRASAPRRYAAWLAVMASLALAVSTLLAATVVSIGIARAEGVGTAPHDHSFAAALLLGLVLVGWSVVTVLMTRDLPRRR